MVSPILQCHVIGTMLQVHCPACNLCASVPDTLAGQRVRCSCGQVFEVSRESTALVRPSDPPPLPPPLPPTSIARSVDDDAEPRPLRRRPRDDDDDDDDYEDAPRRRRRRRYGDECPYCGYAGRPVLRDQISAAGWVVFTILLLFCWPLFFIGLLIREQYMACGDCGARIS